MVSQRCDGIISVLLATLNGARRLEETLDAFTRIDYPRTGWELIVVDNNSSDDTREVLKEWEARLPLTALHEPTPGKARSMNRAIQVARGHLLVMTDDDITPDPCWLSAYADGATNHPDAQMFCGPIEPDWPVHPPTWILDVVDLGLVFAACPPREEGPCPPDVVWGPNMAMRSTLRERGFLLNERLGPGAGPRHHVGDDTEFARMVASTNHIIVHLPRAAVRHRIPLEHLREPWILERIELGGFARPLLDGVGQRTHLTRLRELVALLSLWVLQPFTWLMRSPGRRYKLRKDFRAKRGLIRGSIERRRIGGPLSRC